MGNHESGAAFTDCFRRALPGAVDKGAGKGLVT